MKEKPVVKIVKGTPTEDGAGVKLIRVIGLDDAREADPFLMLDAFDSSDPADYLAGFPMHPHRGIETVTYLIQGRIDHRDSLGNHGAIGPGQAQWMTAGSGILHEEMPRESERLFGLQLWVNLPSAQKMTAPRYFDITEAMIPEVKLPGGTARVIAGAALGAHGVEPRHVKATMLDIRLEPGAALTLPLEAEATALVYTLEGEGRFGPEGGWVDARTAVILGRGDALTAEAGAQGLRFALFAGRPLGEPIAWGGPVVMNTQAELRAAFEELEAGTFIR